MEDFSKVSLGFAEFVSQLLHETFDGVLSAQSYQLEKYIELEKALSLSNQQFKELYIGDEEIKNKEIELLGVSVDEIVNVSNELKVLIKNSFEDFDESGFIVKNKLTASGKSFLKQKTLDKLIAEKKDKLNLLVNKSEMLKVVVDSGEIRAKLELSNLYKSDTANTKQLKSTRKEIVSKSTDTKTTLPLTAKEIDIKGLKVTEITDPQSLQKTLLIDKSLINKISKQSELSDKVRLVAVPAQVSSSSNLYSEIVIKFKTV